ncbi:MAG: hypothetical protein HFI90_11215 [Clostridia bacterium]|nr:hypothetical protein [Clostridia bacterium]
MELCQYQQWKNREEYRDSSGKTRISCRKTGQLCHCQRWCKQEEKYVISDHPARYCKYYKNILEK